MAGKSMSILIFVISCLSIAKGNNAFNNFQQFPNGMSQGDQWCGENSNSIFLSPLRIAAWNIQGWDVNRNIEGNVAAYNYVSEIINRYDIIVLQGVVDSTPEDLPDERSSIYNLLRSVNEKAYEFSLHRAALPKAHYNVSVSERVGRNSHKEQYVFFYRIDVVSVNETLKYSDEEFTYDPFIVVFNTPTLDLEMITLVSLHVSPSSAPQEIDALINVFDYLKENFLLNDVLFLGDFSAGCTYVTKKDWESLQLYLDERFTWLFSNDVITTTNFTTCPYDRMVVAGSNLTGIVYEKSAKAYHYEDNYYADLDAMNALLKISDHLPIEVKLKGKVSTHNMIFLSVTTGPVYPPLPALTRYYLDCQEVFLLESRIVNLIFDCCEDCDNKLSIKNLLQKNFFMYGNAYLNHTIDTFIPDNVQCLGKKWHVVHNNLQLFLSKCGNRPTYANYGGTLKQTGFNFPDRASLLIFLEEMTSVHGCIYTNEIKSVISHKVRYGALSDPSIFMQGIPNGKSLSLFCNKNQCFVTASTLVPYM